MFLFFSLFWRNDRIRSKGFLVHRQQATDRGVLHLAHFQTIGVASGGKQTEEVAAGKYHPYPGCLSKWRKIVQKP